MQGLAGQAVLCSESEDEGDRQGAWPDDEAEEEDDELEVSFKGQKDELS